MASPAELHRLPPHAVRFLQAHPGALSALRAAAYLAAGFLLAGAGLGGAPTALALAPVCAEPFGLCAICAYLGALLGYGAFWGPAASVEPAAAGFLLLAGNCLFRELLPAQRRWFAPLAAGGVYLLIGMIFLLQQSFAPRAALLLTLRLVSLSCFLRALTGERRRVRRLAWSIGLLAGMMRVTLPFDVPLAAPVAAALSAACAAAPSGMLVAAACGLTLDLGCEPSPPQTALFCLAAFAAARCAPRKLARAAVFAGSYLLGVMLWGGEHAGWTLGVMLGALCAAALPEGLLLPAAEAPAPPSAAPVQQTAALLRDLQAQLTPPPGPAESPGADALIFDRAADTVCRGCLKRQLCWDERGEQTYHALASCAETLVRQAEARPEDLPPAFTAVCIRVPAFCEAVTAALHAQRVQLQALARCEEARRIASAAYGHMARMLDAEAAAPDERPAQFEPELGVRAVGLRGDTLCGDCGTSFRCGCIQYVLLLDGMGTGAEARAHAEASAALLRQLLSLQMPPEDALQTLNELYVLRGDGCFSTLDLLRLDLASGEGLLYKWGAAPSYLKRGETVKKIGTASPPPGLGVGERHHAECVRLSLQRGELLVLATDGIPCAPLEQFLRACGELSPRELAAGAVACAGESDPDDRTAAVIRLRPTALQPQHTTRRARKLSNSAPKAHI